MHLSTIIFKPQLYKCSVILDVTQRIDAFFYKRYSLNSSDILEIGYHCRHDLGCSKC